jgi:hypothetical protein
MRAEAERLLVEECGTNVPGCAKWPAWRIDRIRFAELRTSDRTIEGLKRAIDLGNRDFRDLLMSAGFGDTVSSHLLWMPEQHAG